MANANHLNSEGAFRTAASALDNRKGASVLIWCGKPLINCHLGLNSALVLATNEPSPCSDLPSWGCEGSLQGACPCPVCRAVLSALVASAVWRGRWRGLWAGAYRSLTDERARIHDYMSRVWCVCLAVQPVRFSA